MPTVNSILVTGVAGYIGSVLVRQLLDKGYKVIGLDRLMYGGESLLGVYNYPNFEFIKGDIRKKEDLIKVVDKIDAVVHLAAIVGDPACTKQPEVARNTNWDGSKLLFDLCEKRENIENFIFASTCSTYGKMDGNTCVNEDSPLNPVSLYAELKVKFEKYLLKSNTRKDFTPTALRFSTVYGISPRMRFDLTVNEFVRELAFNRKLLIYGEQFWRSYCHVEDIARACFLVLESEPNKVNHEAFGVGDTKENYQKKMIVDELLKTYPEGEIKYVQKDEDPRGYRVDFSKIKDVLGYSITKRVSDGIKELSKILSNGLLPDPFNKKYKNI